MSTKTPIRVIKREERSRREKGEASDSPKKETAKETARDMVSTVTKWVNEFQQKRRSETEQAIKTLLKRPPRPSEA
jgi:hypothetical protein